MDRDFKLLLKAWLWLAWLCLIGYIVAHFGIGPALDEMNEPEPRPMPTCTADQTLAENIDTGVLVCLEENDDARFETTP